MDRKRNLLIWLVIALFSSALSGCLEHGGDADFTVNDQAVTTIHAKYSSSAVVILDQTITNPFAERVFKIVDEENQKVNQVKFKFNEKENNFYFLVDTDYDYNHNLLFNVVEELDDINIDSRADYFISPQMSINLITQKQNVLETTIPMIHVKKTTVFGGSSGFGYDFLHNQVVFEEFNSDIWFAYFPVEPSSSSRIQLRGFIKRDKARWLQNIYTMPYAIEYQKLDLESDDKLFYVRLSDANQGDVHKRWVAMNISTIIKTEVLKLAIHYTVPQDVPDFNLGR